MRLTLSLAFALTVLAAAPGEAQERGRGRASDDSVPKNLLPPPGMCRIWLPNVPAAKQAAPTDCATAVRNRPATARVIFGDSVATSGRSAQRGRSGAPGRGTPVTTPTGGQLPIPNMVPPGKAKPPPPKPPPPSSKDERRER